MTTLWTAPGYCRNCSAGPFQILNHAGSTLCPTCGHDLCGGMLDNPRVLIDDTHAVMTRRAFDELPEYSCSVPTGTTIGKRWKRSEFYAGFRPGGPYPGRWFMWEYVPSDREGYVGIKSREILILDDAGGAR